MSRPMYSRFSIVLSVALLVVWLEIAGETPGHMRIPPFRPNNGATVKEPPREVRIQFTEAVELAFSQITVKGAKGEVVSQGKLRQLANDTLAVDLLRFRRELLRRMAGAFRRYPYYRRYVALHSAAGK